MKRTIVLTNDTQRKFDEICWATMANIITLSKNSDVVAIAPFDPKNREHMFVLHIAKAAAAVAGKEVGLDVNRFQLWNLNRGLNKDNRYTKLNGRDYTYAINPTMLLKDMRDWASELMTSKNFDFGRIYDAFYAQKGKVK